MYKKSVKKLDNYSSKKEPKEPKESKGLKGLKGLYTMKNKFVKLDVSLLQKLKSLNLISASTTVFFILKLENPWSDKPIQIFPLEIAKKWKLSKSRVYDAIKKFINLGLLKYLGNNTYEWISIDESIDMEEYSHIWENSQEQENQDSQEQEQDSQKWEEDSQKQENNSQQWEENSQKWENQSLKPLPDKDFEVPQTNKTNKTNKTSFLRTNKNFSIHEDKTFKQGEECLVSSTSRVKEESLNTEVVSEDKYSAPAESVLYPQKIETYPKGPWLDQNGRPHSEFVLWMARNWKRDFSNRSHQSIDEIVPSVLSYFKKNDNIEVWWNSYCAIAEKNIENIQMRSNAGFQMNSEDVKRYAIASSVLSPVSTFLPVSSTVSSVSNEESVSVVPVTDVVDKDYEQRALNFHQISHIVKNIVKTKFIPNSLQSKQWVSSIDSGSRKAQQLLQVNSSNYYFVDENGEEW